MYDSVHNSALLSILFKHRRSKRRLHEKQPVTCMFNGTIFFVEDFYNIVVKSKKTLNLYLSL